MRRISRAAALAGVACLSLAAAAQAQPARAPPPGPSAPAALEAVASFPDQQITGVAVSRSGRVFVNLPRWTVDVPISVGEVKAGRIAAYPDDAWNGYRNARGAANQPGRQFVCVQNLVFDHADNLWIVDPGAPGQTGPLPGAAKLVKIDVRTNKVVQVIAVGESGAPPGSYLNDVRFSPDDRFAYLTDSGIKGALVVVDLVSGQSWRAQDGDPSTQVDRKVQVTVEGAPLRRPDGRQPEFAADSIALSPDGATLYWQPLTGDTLYKVATAELQEPGRARAAKAQAVGKTHPTDGIWIDAAGRLYLTNPGESSVEVADRPGAPLRTLLKDPARLRWPDTFAQGPDGALYVTASHIQDSPWFRPEAKTTPSAIFRLPAR